MTEKITGTIAMPLRGLTGKDGLSAYQVAVKNGFLGSEEDWLRTIATKEALEKVKEDSEDVIVSDNSTEVFYLNKNTREVVLKNKSINIVVPKDCFVGWRVVLNLTEVESVEHFDVGFDYPSLMFGSDAPWQMPQEGKTYILAKIADNYMPSDYVLYSIAGTERHTKEEQETIEKAHIHENLKTLNESSNLFSNVLRGTATGTVVALCDVSPVEHKMKCVVRSKNLLVYPYADSTITKNGITFTDNKDGSVTINGTAEGDTIFNLTDSSCPLEVAAGAVLAVKKIHENADSNVSFNWQEKLEDGSWETLSSNRNEDVVYTVKAGTMHFYISIPSGTTVDNLTVYPQVETGTQSTAWTPYISDLSTIKIRQIEKNLVTYPFAMNAESASKNGITFTDNKDGSVTIDGTAQERTSFAFSNNLNPLILPVGETVTLLKSGYQYSIRDVVNKEYSTVRAEATVSKDAVFVTENDAFSVYIHLSKDTTVNRKTVRPCLILGGIDKITEYPVCKDGTVSVAALLAPNMTLIPDKEGVVIDIIYNRDINKAFEELTQAIISLGGNV